MIFETFEDHLDRLLIEERDYKAYEQVLREGKEDYYYLAESWLDVSKFNTEEHEAWLEHHGHYGMSAIVFFASMIRSRQSLEAEDRLNNIKLAVNFLKSEGIEDVTVPMLLNGSNGSEELLNIALKILQTDQRPSTSKESFSSSKKNMNRTDVRNAFLKHLIKEKNIPLDDNGYCDLKKQDVWDKLYNAYQAIIENVKNKKAPSPECPSNIYEYILLVSTFNIFTSGKDDFFSSSKNKVIKEIIQFKKGRKSH